MKARCQEVRCVPVELYRKEVCWHRSSLLILDGTRLKPRSNPSRLHCVTDSPTSPLIATHQVHPACIIPVMGWASIENIQWLWKIVSGPAMWAVSLAGGLVYGILLILLVAGLRAAAVHKRRKMIRAKYLLIEDYRERIQKARDALETEKAKLLEAQQLHVMQQEADALAEEERQKAEALLKQKEEEERRQKEEEEVSKHNAFTSVVNAFLVDISEMRQVPPPPLVTPTTVRKTVPTPAGPGMTVVGVLTPSNVSSRGSSSDSELSGHGRSRSAPKKRKESSSSSEDDKRKRQKKITKKPHKKALTSSSSSDYERRDRHKRKKETQVKKSKKKH
eukprot:Blabericola_migrator_1__4290@NODE_2317_length_2945_cov_156_407922_g1453_i0_p2_GENE_NODE_2317_length_2945_cov_156_407922_g1453_i0NODE_2317_length_2945_cov_156_407922_g1453_i0_p2_ORF_typecomplete_len334_score64_26SMC_N/PF02463_19/0_00037Selenoprotein_S/PF06936_11/0_027Selenoprotein_S/PF06936_11/1_7e02HrpE/PF06188_12/1_7_NODE_2317_length_2945_cov_156_407922_g1453_i016822683